jgi:hypothetical protein
MSALFSTYGAEIVYTKLANYKKSFYKNMSILEWLKKMGRKNPSKKTKPRSGGGVGAVDSLEAELSDLFKTLPPIKRAELNKVP